MHRPDPGRRSSRLAITLGVALVAFLLVLGAVAVRDRVADQRFDLVRWEISTFPAKWLHVAGGPFRDDPDHDEVIRTYFALAERDGEEGRALQKTVEAAIEGRIDAVLREMGLSARITLPGSVFPPVDVELTSPPRVVVESPRAVIRRSSIELLTPGLTLDQAQAIEVEREARPDTSALVVGSGGVATYPAVVSNRGTYASAVATAAHEWIHHYLAFYPLGLRYFTTGDLSAINETVADIAGEEIAARVLERWGDPTRPAEPAPAPTPSSAEEPRPRPSVDTNAVLRELRLEVDALLEGERVQEAEQRMEEVRLELAAAGVVIRRINQAYFAWFGTYAARPDATDPLGPQLRGIRARSASLVEFMERIRGVRSRADVEAIAERLDVRVP